MFKDFLFPFFQSILCMFVIFVLCLFTIYIGNTAFQAGVSNIESNMANEQVVAKKLPVTSTTVIKPKTISNPIVSSENNTEKPILYNNTYDFSGFIKLLTYVLGGLAGFYILKKIKFSLIHQIFMTKRTIKKANEIMSINAGKDLKINLLNIIERKISYNEIYLETVDSVTLKVLNKELIIVRDVFKNDLI